VLGAAASDLIDELATPIEIKGIVKEQEFGWL
jgi:hypothetical protein